MSFRRSIVPTGACEPAVPEKTFNSAFRRFFDIPDSEPIAAKLTVRAYPRGRDSVLAGGAGVTRTIDKNFISMPVSVPIATATTAARPSTDQVPNPTSNSNTNPNRNTATESNHSSLTLASRPSTPAPATTQNHHQTGPSSPLKFELVGLSALIQQSYKDISILRKAHAEEARLKSEKGEIVEMIDFDRVEGNLKRFEGVYSEFLKGESGNESETEEAKTSKEVHLVAMRCKREEVPPTQIRRGAGVPMTRVAESRST